MNVTRMKFANWRLAALLASVLAPAVAAADCDISRDDSGEYRAICRFDIDSKPPTTRDIEVKYRAGRADLTIDKFKYFLRGNDLEVQVEIRNDGQVGSGPSEVVVAIEIWNPFNDLQYDRIDDVTAHVPAIAAGSSVRVLLTTISLPDMVDVDVFTAALVDPTPPFPGRVVEANEANNARLHVCRVFGPNPVFDPPPPPACY